MTTRTRAARDLAPSRLSPGLTVLIVTAALYFARDVFMPMALALLLAFLLAPVVARLRRWGLGRVFPVLAVVGVVSCVLLGLAILFFVQVVDLARAIPRYKGNVEAKLASLSHGPVEGVMEAIGSLEAILPGAKPPSPMAPVDQPMPVEVVEEPFSHRMAMARTVLGPVFEPLGVSLLVFIFVVFMLLSWEDLRDRVLRLSGQGQLHLTTEALEDASRRVSHYLAMQLVVNASVGATVGLGLWLLGVPNAPLWGLLSLTLRFIPYLGPWLGALMPLTLAFASFPGWNQVLLVAGMFAVIELIANNVLEPWLYGSSTGVSPIAILVAAVFWAWLWGPVGLILATPLTVCVMVAGRYVPQLEFLAVLLSDESALPPGARLYHRLLAMRAEDADEVVETYRAGADLERLYDDVLLPALALAERDRHRDALPKDRQDLVYRGLRAFAEEAGSGRLREPTKAEEHAVGPGAVLCIAAEDEADAISARMAAHLVREAGVPATDLGRSPLRKVIHWMAVNKPRAVLIAAMPPFAALSARNRTRKIKALFPDVPIIVGLWGTESTQGKAVARLKDAGAAAVAVRLGEACRFMLDGEPDPVTPS